MEIIWGALQTLMPGSHPQESCFNWCGNGPRHGRLSKLSQVMLTRSILKNRYCVILIFLDHIYLFLSSLDLSIAVNSWLSFLIVPLIKSSPSVLPSPNKGFSLRVPSNSSDCRVVDWKYPFVCLFGCLLLS